MFTAYKSKLIIANKSHILMPLVKLSYRNSKLHLLYKNAAEVDIAPALGKITKTVKYRSRAPGQSVCLKGMSRIITMHGFTLTTITKAEKTKLRSKN